MIDTILWDLDGTLLGTRGLGRPATKRAIRETFGVLVNMDNYQFGGKTDFQTLTILLEDHGYDENRLRPMMPRFAKAMATAMDELSAQHPIFAVPGALEVIDELAAQPRLAHGIVTGNTRPSAMVKLRGAGFDVDGFPFGAFGDESPRRGELPTLAMERAAQVLGREADPQSVLIVGDTTMDIRAAREAGVQVCAVATGSDDVETLRAAGPDYLIDDLTQFTGVVPLV